MGLPPLADDRTEGVILGTFPGPLSLEKKAYYADRRNQFWVIVERLVAKPVVARPYGDRVAELLERRIGLWDVIHSCEREGAADKKIRNAVPNDLADFLRRHPRIRVLLTNGEKPAEWLRRFQKSALVDLRALPLEILPSSSGANTHLSVDAKAGVWAAVLRKHGL